MDDLLFLLEATANCPLVTTLDIVETTAASVMKFICSLSVALATTVETLKVVIPTIMLRIAILKQVSYPGFK